MFARHPLAPGEVPASGEGLGMPGRYGNLALYIVASGPPERNERFVTKDSAGKYADPLEHAGLPMLFEFAHGLQLVSLFCTVYQ